MGPQRSALAEAREARRRHVVPVNIGGTKTSSRRPSEQTRAGQDRYPVNSAVITGATVPVIDFPVDSWLQVMDVNLNGTFYCCREIVPMMTAQGYGRIINIASVAGKEGNPRASAYSASKAAVIGFTKSLGKELATSGVLVNCVTPATFESPILDQLPKSQIDYMRSAFRWAGWERWRKSPLGLLAGQRGMFSDRRLRFRAAGQLLIFRCAPHQ
jgi:3-oxoacyl-[acyl-carrier protein] reductase